MAMPACSMTGLKRLRATIATWRARRQSRLELLRMDEVTLRDIGLSPSTARYEGLRPFWSPLSLAPEGRNEEKRGITGTR